ncbi:hypothetical protein [Laribacter hongkongensis]|uniref:Uncharacterized protein n=1 Tax=Laribacter hongkongensis TaxID=168471 RepID=A0A248LIK8_9NEIS|nr:hypothetical protein [Laribacter hongkongensis]ASJ24311.1 hypothetical protein LHGZ1_1480 [Laribacter hongkongensis]MCG9041992.1 hypothetical protein [Laribacter hongkongensis]MCG9069004.1 hypothetical protein [Laribacter hongkongensis]MCG9087714.1 hypothetical protein [Laribacter hongkongensis]MCG9110829.1 hypothetical protein [Laribacter hongkongensis]
MTALPKSTLSAPASPLPDGWTRISHDAIERGPYRIRKSVAGQPGRETPVYHATCHGGMVGVTGAGLEPAITLCHQHEARHGHL